MNAALNSIGSSFRLALAAGLLCVGVASALAEQSKLFVFWDTVSPDGKYAIAWSTTGKVTPDDLPLPSEPGENPVANYVVEVASRKIVVQLPEGHYWDLHGAGRPNHYSMETVWSENSRSMLAIYDSRWSTDAVFLVDLSVPRAVRIEKQLEASFKRTLQSTRGSQYTQYEDRLAITFGSPWFVASDRFLVSAYAEIPKQESPDFNLDLYFQIENGGTSVTLANSGPSSGQEPADRALNRIYRKLHGLLSADDQKSLVEEERAWLIKRDAIKTGPQKEAFIEARTQDLQSRVEKIIEAKE
jgi:hypothetical protein